MSDDSEICGYETAKGTPCQNPATEDGHCWLKAHGGDVQNGRDFEIGESDHDDILEAARMGASKAGCARAAGVEPPSLNRYLDSHADFRSAFTRARAKGEQRLLSGPLWNEDGAEREMDGQHARFLLSTSFDYSKTEKKEVDMDADIDADVAGDVTAEFVTYTADNDETE